MDKTQIIETLRNCNELRSRIERVADALDLGWCEDDGICLDDTDFDNPDETTIQLNWTEWGRGHDHDVMEEAIPLRLLWESDSVESIEAEKKRRVEELKRRRHQEAIRSAQRSVNEARRRVQTAESSAKAHLKAAEDRLNRLKEQAT